MKKHCRDSGSSIEQFCQQHKLTRSCLACFAGVLFTLTNRYVNPENTLAFDLMVFILLMCVIGGMGTLYGAVIGATLFLLAQNYLQDLLKLLGQQFPSESLTADLVAPKHWLLWFAVCDQRLFFPRGLLVSLLMESVCALVIGMSVSK